MKYGGIRAIGPRLGRHMASLWERPDADILLPVPLHVGSSRGYNQAFEIARGLGRVWGIEAADAARWSRYVPHRAGLGMNERMALSSEDFKVPNELAGLRVAIVDDVCTTGATLSRLASACGSAGAIVIGAYVASAPLYGKIDDNFF
jgi:predicted amidophosphoribosyltransferase